MEPTGFSQLAEELGHTLVGRVACDRLTRAIYATDGSIYEIIPDGVAFPESIEDVSTAVKLCSQHNVPITPRGAGTGLAGGAVNRGVQLDCSRYMNRILNIDPAARTARVEPGVVLDELNAALKDHGLHFAPDVATSSRATIGGMIGNNSCGSHSVVYGRTVDHVLAVDVVLTDGSLCTWGKGVDTPDNALARACTVALKRVATDLADEIKARFPKVMRSNGGYALDRLADDGQRINAETLLCGSEGTLGVIVGATLNLEPLPAHQALIVAHFDDLLGALAATPQVLEHKPAAVELIDEKIMSAAQANVSLMKKCGFIEGNPEAILVIELYDDSPSSLEGRSDALVSEMKARSLGYTHCQITDPDEQANVWAMRNAGLGLLMSAPGDRKAYAFVEDTCVDPAKLAEYIGRFQAVLEEEQCEQAGFYAHASVGVIHARPVLNLKQDADVQKMRSIADRISSLALEYGGTMTGEHGDGIIRSSWLEKIYGPKIMTAFREIKETFDPHYILNPGKIVAPLPMTENLRYGRDFKANDPITHLDFSEHGGMSGLAGMCSGVGQCRQRLVGTMCPSYIATSDETHTTRARANALRLALSDRKIIDGLADPALTEVMDLCISCKACKSECPTGTDMAKLKTEWLSYRNRSFGVSRQSRFIADSIHLAKWGSAFSPISNWLAQSNLMRRWMERRYGLDRRMPPPRFAHQTFRRWFKRYRKRTGSPGPADQPRVVYFVDTWTNHYEPRIGIATVKALESLGYRVIVPSTQCCGRPLISKGLLAEAKALAEQNAGVLGSFAQRNVPIIGTEPSCVSALNDELPQLVRTPLAKRVAEATVDIETFLVRALDRNPTILEASRPTNPAIYHGHCHQKALVGTDDAMTILRACTGERASEINSGCCGMAGSFGHELEHYDVAKTIGAERLFPAILDQPDQQVVASGFSCRHQIRHHTGSSAEHVIEIVAEALGVV